MFSNNLCPSCYQIFCEYSNKPSVPLSAFQVSSTGCSNCHNAVLSSMAQPQSQQFVAEVGSSEVETYFQGSSSWTTQAYQTRPLATEYFQKPLEDDEDGTNLNITDPRKFEENSSNNQVTNENVNFVTTPNNLPQDTSFEENETILDWLMNFDNIADVAASESVEQQLLESELVQNNYTAVETQANLQPQVATESHLTIASTDIKGCYGNLTHVEKTYSCSGENENLINGQKLLNSSDGKKLKAKKISRFDSKLYPVYTIDTYQRVSYDKIMPKITSILSNSSERDDRFYICRYGSDCHKFFTSLYGIKKHLFSHLFFFYCTTCELKYHHPSTLGKHLKTCKATDTKSKTESTVVNYSLSACIASAPDSVDIQLQLDAESSSIKPFWSQFSHFNYPIHRRDNCDEVSIDEVLAKLPENYAIIINGKKRIYVCLLDHECRRSYATVLRLTKHIFRQFYFYKCPACGNEFCDPGKIKKHPSVCKGKSDQLCSKHNDSILVEPYWCKFSDFEHPIYRNDNCDQVSIDDVMAKLQENYASIINGKKRIYVCLLDHDCLRLHSSLQKITSHLFCEFYFYKCSACSKTLFEPNSFKSHLWTCKGKSTQMFSKRNTLVSDESNSKGREFKMSNLAPTFSCSSTDYRELETTANLVNETIEESSTVPEHQITLLNKPIPSSSDNMGRVNERVAVTNNVTFWLNEAQTKKRKY